MKKRILELDVFRGIAALSVLLFHYTTQYNRLFRHREDLFFYFPYGDYGFHLFFIISGFVIFMTLHTAKCGTDFIVKRFSRIYPAYWIAVILTFSVVLIFGLPGRQIGLKDAFINLTMLQQFFGIKSVDSIYWTLQLELFFYITMLAIYRLRLLEKIENIAIFALIVQIAVKAVRVDPVFFLDYSHLFIMGIIFYRMAKERKPSVKEICIILVCLLAQGLVGGFKSSLLIAGFAGLFTLAITDRLTFVNNRVLVYLGTISYSLYLVHQNIGYIVIQKMEGIGVSANLSVLSAIVVSFMLATTVTFFVEKPAQHFIRERYFKFRDAGA